MDESKPVIGITTDIKEENFVIEMKYAISVANAGGIPLLLPSISEKTDLLEETVAKVDGLLLPGSRDMDPKFYNETPHPKLRPMRLERTESEMIVLEEAINRNIPVLGICGGMQLINVFFGGSLYQDINSQLPKALNHENGSEHEISIEDDTILKRIIHAERFAAKSHHHQSVKVLGKGLRVNAKSSDGIIEGIEAPRSFILGIQWHPEVDEGEISDRIFRAFIEECRR